MIFPQKIMRLVTHLSQRKMNEWATQKTSSRYVMDRCIANQQLANCSFLMKLQWTRDSIVNPQRKSICYKQFSQRVDEKLNKSARVKTQLKKKMPRHRSLYLTVTILRKQPLNNLKIKKSHLPFVTVSIFPMPSHDAVSPTPFMTIYYLYFQITAYKRKKQTSILSINF